MKLWKLLVFSLFLTACSAASTAAGDPASSEQEPAQPANNPQPAVRLKNLGPAPELENEVWLNTDQPLRLADLRGQVVLLDMWTFG
ncbi:MAG: hypothetical protein JXB38_08265 [Anaerolineales bacterium]|nr:hypothetical protein [Anaerolineales bacterium]